MLAVVLAGGELDVSQRVVAVAATADLVVAADSGVRHAAPLGLNVDVLIGDFDSSAAPALSAAEVVRFPVAKDQTDSHLAVREAVHRGADKVVLLGGLHGARVDHGLANVGLLAAPEFAQIDLRAVAGDDEIRAVRAEARVEGRPGDLVSLLAVTARVTGITTDGLLYPLHNGVLRRGETRGVSNELLGESGSVHVRTGTLLVIHRSGGDPNRLA